MTPGVLLVIVLAAGWVFDRVVLGNRITRLERAVGIQKQREIDRLLEG